MPKLQDVQDVTVVFPGASETFVNTTVTHNLTDENGDSITPDQVNIEIVAFSAVADLQRLINFVITRSSPEDGTFILRAQGRAAFEGAAEFTLRVCSIMFHSIQGDDHTA